MSNDDPRPPTPILSPELLDELCSADLDGELDAACEDLGVPIADARDALAAYGPRRRQLDGARAAVGTTDDTDALDELDRRRIVGATVARFARPRSATRLRPVLAVVAAAAAVALVAIAATSLRRHDSAKSTAAGPSAAATATTTTVAPRDLGDVADGRDIAQRLGIAHAPAPAPATTNAEQSYSVTTTASGQPSTQRSVDGKKPSPLSDRFNLTEAANPQRCLADLPEASGSTGLRIVATARWHGETITIARGALNGAVVLWGFRPSNCTIAVFYTGS